MLFSHWCLSLVCSQDILCGNPLYPLYTLPLICCFHPRGDGCFPLGVKKGGPSHMAITIDHWNWCVCVCSPKFSEKHHLSQGTSGTLCLTLSCSDNSDVPFLHYSMICFPYIVLESNSLIKTFIEVYFPLIINHNKPSMGPHLWKLPNQLIKTSNFWGIDV